MKRAKERVAREKDEMAALSESVDHEKFNKFRWPQKVSRSKLVRLYQGEAMGLLDEDLLEDVGFALYDRCKQGRDTHAQMDMGRMLCHHCGAVLTPSGYSTPAQCACGYWYTYREYRRSCNAHNMPAGRAKPIFDHFADKWPGCKGAKEKMLLIDWMIHECHVSIMSGLEGRSVCVNLIEGTAAQLREMLEALAGK